jgi:CheY-like chemotaxis protein
VSSRPWIASRIPEGIYARALQGNSGGKAMSASGSASPVDGVLGTEVEAKNLGRILCADDDAVCLRLLCGMLVPAGFTVECVSDGELAFARWNEQRFDLLITDHDMPKMNGLQLVTAIRRTGSSGKIIVISGSVVPSEEEAYRALAVNDIMAKPASRRALLDAIQRSNPVRESSR